MSTTAFAFIVFFCGMALLAFARHSIYGLLLYLGVLYSAPQYHWWGADLPDLRWSLLAAALTLVASFVNPPAAASLNAGKLARQPVLFALIAFVFWVALQSLWALNEEKHQELLVLLIKYVVLVALIYRCIDSERHLRWFLWGHVTGCWFLGLDAYITHVGGRFEGFSGPDFNEANAGALQVMTGMFVAAGLFMTGKWWERLLLFLFMPFMVNAVILSGSRSGFLALGLAGVVFNYFTPAKHRLRVLSLSALAIVVFGILTNEQFWSRIETITARGERIEGVDTGGGRLEIVEAQVKMFREHPLGCGHRCTVTLSPQYMDDWLLVGPPGNRGRSSHSTVMTMLTEHGVIGIAFHTLFLLWLAVALHSLPRPKHLVGAEQSFLHAGIAAAFAALVVGDLFVDYLKLEVRFWLIALILVLVKLKAMARAEEGLVQHSAAPARADGPLPGRVLQPDPEPPGSADTAPVAIARAPGAMVQNAPIRSRRRMSNSNS